MVDLKQFCAKNDPRKHLEAPWQEDGKSFATDGNIAIMLHTTPAELTGPVETMKGQLQRLIAGTSNCSKALEIEFPSEAAAKCISCSGTGLIIESECEECDGDGDFSYGSHTYTCKECTGNGTTIESASVSSPRSRTCVECNGRGTESRFIDLCCDGVTYKFQEKYLRAIQALPVGRLLVGGNNTVGARIEFDGGEGILMPCRI